MRISDWSSDVCSSDLKATNQYAEDIKGFDPPFWLDDQRNIALTNQNHDVALFEYFKPGTVLGHYFRSEEHTSELQSLMRISYAVFCLKKKKKRKIKINIYSKEHTTNNQIIN